MRFKWKCRSMKVYLLKCAHGSKSEILLREREVLSEFSDYQLILPLEERFSGHTELFKCDISELPSFDNIFYGVSEV